MKTIVICFFLGYVVDAFMVANLPPPAAQEMASVTLLVSSSPQPSSLPFSSTNLPSQRQLLSDATSCVSSSSSLLSASPPTAPAPAPVPAAGATTKQSIASTSFGIAAINYHGVVPTTESDEYVVVTNAKKEPVDVSGYYIYVATTGNQGPTFSFAKGTVIKPNQSVRVYTNEVHKETGGYSFESGKAIWNNKGGLAVMMDANGKKVSEFKY